MKWRRQWRIFQARSLRLRKWTPSMTKRTCSSSFSVVSSTPNSQTTERNSRTKTKHISITTVSSPTLSSHSASTVLVVQTRSKKSLNSNKKSQLNYLMVHSPNTNTGSCKPKVPNSKPSSPIHTLILRKPSVTIWPRSWGSRNLNSPYEFHQLVPIRLEALLHLHQLPTPGDPSWLDDQKRILNTNQQKWYQ